MNKLIITRLLLVNYTRMSEAGISRFLFEPDSAHTLQLILGSNGSGKSSLFHVLWPLPADANDFTANDGLFEIDFQYKGHQYQIRSVFAEKSYHHFIKDGIELNDDHKIGMCYTLCEEHFKVTNEIRNLALGYEKLTTMGPARRRYWMVKLADSDFTYAMSRYKKITETHRDTQGSIKRLSKRLLDEKNKMTPPETVIKINEEYREIKELMTEIYNSKNSQIEPSDKIRDSLGDNHQVLKQTVKEIDQLNLDLITASGFTSIEDVNTAHDVTKVEIASQQQLLQQHYQEHTRIKKKYDAMIKAGTESMTDLNNRLTDTIALIEKEKVHLCYPTVKPATNNTYAQALQLIDSVYFELYEKINLLPSNVDLYSRSQAETSQGRVEFDTKQLNALEMRIMRLKADIDHQRDHVQKNNTVCPQCQYTWSQKASESDLQKAELLIVQLTEDKEKLITSIEKHRQYLGNYNVYAEQYRDVIRLMKSSFILVNYFNAINPDNLLVTNPQSVANDLSIVKKDLFHQAEIERLTVIMNAIHEKLELKKSLATDTLEFLEAELKLLEEKTGSTTVLIRNLNDKLKSTQLLIQQNNQINKLNTQLKGHYTTSRELTKQFIYSRYQEALTQLILALQTQLVRKEDVLSQITNQQNVLAEIDHQLEEAIMEERISRAMHMALSPTTGAIAEGLYRFMNVFVHRLNIIINSIWNSSLKIEPFVLQEGQADLDYKFPYTGKTEVPKNDVSEGSKSMIELFNYSFRHCALQQLGLGFLPVFLDEFEAPFDDVHRERIIYFIKKLLDDEVAGQIFTISHYESSHGAFSGLAQTCVLSKDNLMLSTNGVYNEHVTIN